MRKVAFLWWVLPILGQSSSYSFVSFDEPLSLPKVVTLNSSSAKTVLSGAESSTGMLRRAIFARGLGPHCFFQGLDPDWTDDDGDPALMVLRVCSTPQNFSFPFFYTCCDQLRTFRDLSIQDKQWAVCIFGTFPSCCCHSVEFNEHCSFFSSCSSCLPRSIASRRPAMARMLLLGLLPYTCFGYVPSISPPLVLEGVCGDLGQGHQGSVPLCPCLALCFPPASWCSCSPKHGISS